MSDALDGIGHECLGGPLDGERRLLVDAQTLVAFRAKATATRYAYRLLAGGQLADAQTDPDYAGYYARAVVEGELVNFWRPRNVPADASRTWRDGDHSEDWKR